MSKEEEQDERRGVHSLGSGEWWKSLEEDPKRKEEKTTFSPSFLSLHFSFSRLLMEVKKSWRREKDHLQEGYS